MFDNIMNFLYILRLTASSVPLTAVVCGWEHTVVLDMKGEVYTWVSSFTRFG
jgi:alpha-tubulin suppressor-like RCC1 family protein